MSETDTSRFIEVLQKVLTEQTFHKMSLGKVGPDANGLLGATARIVDLKAGTHLAVTFKKARNEEVHNYPIEFAATEIAPLLGPVFRQADLFTANGSWHLLCNKKGVAKLLHKAAVLTQAPDRNHNKVRAPKLDLHLFQWPRELGLVDQQGNPSTSMRSKIHQIEKFIEIVDNHFGNLTTAPKLGTLKIIDLGAGRGYLSFALYQWLTVTKGLTVELEAVEIQQHLVDQCNQSARIAGFSGLKFTKARIDQIPISQRDIVVALHACDTASDDALALAIRSGARFIFAAPCCHQELRSNLTNKGGLDAILKQGILLERQTEILSDGLRALVLESYGYKTKVMEFVPAEHSGKNILIVAEASNNMIKQEVDSTKLAQINAIKTQFGIERIYLQALLELENLSDLSPPWRKLGVVARESL